MTRLLPLLDSNQYSAIIFSIFQNTFITLIFQYLSSNQNLRVSGILFEIKFHLGWFYLNHMESIAREFDLLACNGKDGPA